MEQLQARTVNVIVICEQKKLTWYNFLYLLPFRDGFPSEEDCSRCQAQLRRQQETGNVVCLGDIGKISQESTFFVSPRKGALYTGGCAASNFPSSGEAQQTNKKNLRATSVDKKIIGLSTPVLLIDS